MKLKRPTAEQQMARIRGHVEKYGISGTSCETHKPEEAICPRALVAWASDENYGSLWTPRKGAAARRVMKALEKVASERATGMYANEYWRADGTGRAAEGYAHSMRKAHDSTKKALDWIDAATELL